MSTLFIFTSVLFFLLIFRDIFFWVWLWQLKEYRLDRFLVHLRETIQGKGSFFTKIAVLKWFLIFGYVFVVFKSNLLSAYQIFIVLVFSLQFFLILKNFSSAFIKRPIFTFKAIIILLLSLFLISLLFFLPLVEKFLWLLLLDKLIFLLVAFFIFAFSFPTSLYQDFKIGRATKKIKEHKKLLVIGVTGSFGKSSTKEYIAQILEKRFPVLKTKGTNNTPIGVANTILSGLKEETEIFVVEMAAYKKGEVKELCQIVRPQIGIITAVSFQHLSLFGSLQNIMEAKYELIKALPKEGLALFNGNNRNAYKLYKLTKKQKVLYQCFDSLYQCFDSSNSRLKKSSRDNIFGFNIKTLKNSIEFDVLIEKKNLHLKAPLIGSHNVENILPAIYIAKYLGTSDGEIKKAVASLVPLPKTMMRHQLSNGVTFIDDTFNANPDAVLAALNYLKIYKGKKIMVLQPMIELGKNAKDEHYRVARAISDVCDYLFLTNNNFYKSIMRGMNNGCIVRIENASEIATFIIENTNSKDVVIFEGKEAARSLSKLL